MSEENIDPEKQNIEPSSLDPQMQEVIDKEVEKLEEQMTNTTKNDEKTALIKDFVTNRLTGKIGTKLLDSLKQAGTKLGMTSSATENLRSGMKKFNEYLANETSNDPDADYNKILKTFQQKLITDPKFPIELTSGEENALTEFYQKQGVGSWNELNKVDPEVMGELKDFINEKGGKVSDPQDAKNLMDNLDQKIRQLETNNKLDKITKLLEDNEFKNREKEAEDGKKVSTNFSDKAKLVLKIIGTLVSVAGFAAVAIFVAEYCIDTSGCIYVQKVADPSVSQQSSKTYCVNKDTTWAPSNCGCSNTPPKDPPSIGTDTKVCSDGKTFPDSVKGGKQCKNVDTLTPPYAYYNYIIMDPISAGIGIGNQVLNDIGDWLSKLTPVLKTIGIIILAVLFVYLLVHILTLFKK